LQELSTNQVKKRSDALTGAPSPADVNDPYIQEIASTALAEVDRRSNALYRQKVVRIVKAQKQVICMYF
jgi:Cystatin domain.